MVSKENLSAASQRADTQGSAASQRADTRALAELNQRSAALGQWDVSIFRPAIHEWKYTTKSTSQPKTGKAFRCTLVSVLDPSQYVNAYLQMRSDNTTPLQEAEGKFKAGLKFRISKVALDNSVSEVRSVSDTRHSSDADSLLLADLLDVRIFAAPCFHSAVAMTSCLQISWM